MSRFSQTACALLLLIAIPSAISAQQRGGGGNGRAATPPWLTRPRHAVRSQTRTVAPPAGGFNFNRDINPMPVQRRSVAPQPPVTPPQSSRRDGRPCSSR